jgi:hypothetical protein
VDQDREFSVPNHLLRPRGFSQIFAAESIGDLPLSASLLPANLSFAHLRANGF